MIFADVLPDYRSLLQQPRAVKCDFSIFFVHFYKIIMCRASLILPVAR